MSKLDITIVAGEINLDLILYGLPEANAHGTRTARQRLRRDARQFLGHSGA
jgi:hypothetical protein